MRSPARLGLIFALLAAPSVASAASLRFLGDLPGDVFESRATRISADASTVVGASRSGTEPGEDAAFYWNAAEGMVELPSAGPSEGKRSSIAYGVNADGSCIVGESTTPNEVVRAEAVVWKPGQPPIPGGFLNGAKRSVMYAVNDACTLAVGAARTVHEIAVAFTIASDSAQIWSLGIPDGYENSAATAIAGQGSFVAGVANHFQDPGGNSEAWRRTPTGPYRLLGLPPGTSTSRIHQLNHNGTVGAATLDGAPARWTPNAKLEPLPLPAGFTGGEALGVSPGGSTFVGRLDGPDGAQAFVSSAALGGTRLLSELLAERGIEVPEGVVLVEAVGVAADELSIAGTAVHANGDLEAFVANLDAPEPGARIAAGESFACALFNQVEIEGEVYDGTHCWGLGNTDTPPPDELVAIAAGRKAICGLNLEGRVACWGDRTQGQDELAGTAAREIHGGDRFMCVRNTTDHLVCTSGAPAEVADLSMAISSFDVGDDHVCVVAAADGAVTCAGPTPDASGVLDVPPGLKASRVFLGRNASCAIGAEGMVHCWGSSDFGQSTDPNGTFQAGAGGPNHVCMLEETAPGAAGAPLYCQGRGTLGTPDGEATPVPPDAVDGERLFTAVAAGGDDVVGFTCALDVAGRPFCFGANANDEACPPGDEDDCDGVPAFADNCIETANPDQLDSDGDGVGDACDVCPGGIDQLDEDTDGFPNACDLCPGQKLAENRECPVSTLFLVTPEEGEIILGPPPVGVAAFAASASVTSASATGDPEVFKLILDCGQDTITAVAGSFAVPDMVTSVIVGNDCGLGGCDPTDPDDLLGDTVDPANSTVINLGDPSTLPENTVGFKFRNDVTGLCGPGQKLRIADIQVFDNIPGQTPAFSLTAVTDELGALIESDAPIGEEPELVLQGFATEPTLLVKLRPDVGGVPNETSVLGEAPFLVEAVFGSIVGANRILGCDNLVGTDPCTGLPRYSCATGTVPQSKMPENVNLSSPLTFVLGPGSSSIPGVPDNQLFYSFEAKLFTTSLGSRKALNPGLNPFLIGTVETGAGGAPAYTTSGLAEVLGIDGSCATDPTRFDAGGSFVVARQTLGGAGVIAQDSDSESSIKPGLDPDGDGLTENDNCPFVQNTNFDFGGRQSPANPDGSIANGIGNECECGDVDGNYRVDSQDEAAIASFLIGAPPPGFKEDFCNVSGAASFSDAPGCGVEDVLEQLKNFDGIPTGIEGKCAAFTGAQ